MRATMRFRLWAHQSERTLPSSAFPHQRCLLKVFVKRHQLEVSTLSCEAKFEPLFRPLQSGIRFLQPPISTIPSAFLANRFPRRRTLDLPRFNCVPAWVRSCLSAGGATSAVGNPRAPTPVHLPFGLGFQTLLESISILSLLGLTTFISNSHLLTIPSNPSSRPP
ncbi:MAG: hypothetical protein ACI85U_002103 [Candidatus Promineifilaceae bacterium]|jgi:hypothetical protein